MKGTEKQVKWAKQIKVKIEEIYPALDFAFQRQIDADTSTPEKAEEIKARWVVETGSTLASDKAAFYIDNFKEILDMNDDKSLETIMFYTLNKVHEVLPARYSRSLVAAYNSIQQDKELYWKQR